MSCRTMVGSTMAPLGRRLFLGAFAGAFALSCEAGPPDQGVDPARLSVETPGGNRIVLPLAAIARRAKAPLLLPPEEPFVIAKFAGSIPNEARAALIHAGYREVSYLPYDALLLERPSGATARPIPGMVAWFGYRAEDRIARDLRPEALANLSGDGPLPVMIHVMPRGDRAAVRRAAAALGARVVGEGVAGEFGRVTALFERRTAARDLESLAALRDVFLLERIHRIGLLNDKSAGTIQSGKQGHDAAQTPIWQHGIRGENQVVAVLDTGLDTNSCFFDGGKAPAFNTWSQSGGYGTMSDPTHRKIVAYDFLYSCDQFPGKSDCDRSSDAMKKTSNAHGTHVTGNILGDSDSKPDVFASQDGMAPAAKVVVQDAGYVVDECGDLPGLGCPVIKLDPIYEQARLQGASIHNNSWGDNENAGPPAGSSNYSARSQDADRFMWEHREFLIVHAAGNNGTGNVEFSVLSPSTNKNGLSVGGTRKTVTSTSDDDISSRSSRGWTSDGRFKPDLMAPMCNASAGTDRMNTGAGNCGTDSGCGTSYASPTAVGAAALVRQYFVDGFYPSLAKNAADRFVPSAALIKAALINSSVAMKGTDNAGGPISPIPSNEQGWGRLQLDQTLYFTGAARKLYVDDHRAGLPAGATTPFTYTLNGVEAGQPLKITLAWTDYPGTPDAPATAPTVTDAASWNAPRLVNDLDLVVTGPGGMYLGNVFANSVSATGGAADKRNNLEQVLLAAPAAGTYTVVVKPVAIVQGDQEFALVVTGAWQSVGGGVPPTDGGVDASVDGPSTSDATPTTSGAGGGATDANPTTGGGAGASGTTSGSAGSSGATGAGGAMGGASGAGGATSGTTGTAGASTPPPPADSTGGDGGCSCVIGRASERPAAGLLFLASIVGSSLRRAPRSRRASLLRRRP